MSRSKPSDRLFAEAAELRAAGSSWEVVAAQVGRAARTVRRWPTLYRARWAAALRAAEARIATEAAAESVLTLRQQLRSEDGKVSRDAAHKLIQYRVALGKKKVARPNKTDPPPGSEVVRVAAYLESLSDDQREELLDRALSVLSAHRDGRHAGGDPPGP
ncbi:MAG TPA: hypothetical protein VFG68_05165 [Fimbriiglobus sp.]|nr:hypothetical protein [Fimbriiglobus sp.]